MDTNWMNNANCRGEPPAMFFDGFEDASLSDKLNVIRLCVDCPVADECYAYGTAFTDTEGIFGGYFFKKGKPKDPFKIRKSGRIKVFA